MRMTIELSRLHGKHLKVCQICKITFKTAFVREKYCSKKCARIQHYGIINRPEFGKVSTGIVGAMNELRVCVDLLSRGYDVFRSVSQSCSCDLLARKNGKIYDIEVKTGYRGGSGYLLYPKHLVKASYAAVVVNQTINYIPEIQ